MSGGTARTARGNRGRGGREARNPGHRRRGGGTRPQSPPAAFSTGQGRVRRPGSRDHTRLRPHLRVRARLCPPPAPAPAPGPSPSRPRQVPAPHAGAERSAGRGRGWVRGCRLQTKESPPPPSPRPPPPAPASPPPAALRFLRPPMVPRFPYLPAGACGGRRGERTRAARRWRAGSARRRGPGAGTRNREADPAEFPAQSCHTGGVGGGRSWGRARLHL